MKSDCMMGEKIRISCSSCFLENACQSCPFTMDWTLGKVRHEVSLEEQSLKELKSDYQQSVVLGNNTIPV